MDSPSPKVFVIRQISGTKMEVVRLGFRDNRATVSKMIDISRKAVLAGEKLALTLADTSAASGGPLNFLSKIGHNSVGSRPKNTKVIFYSYLSEHSFQKR